jgi:hypothetical protein
LAFHYSILSGITSIYGVRIDLVALIVALVALYKREMAVLWFSLSAAIVAGTSNLEIMYWEMILLAGSGLIINQISTRINLESMTSRVLILAGFLLIHNIFITFLISSADVLFQTYRVILPSTLYSLIIGWFILQIKDGKITWRKTKELF